MTHGFTGMAETGLGTAKVTKPTGTTIRTERIFDAPRQVVWRAFTDPKLLARWWGRSNPLDVERLEVRNGGKWRFVEHAPGEKPMGFEGEFRDVAPPDRLTQSFRWDGMTGQELTTTTTFEEVGDRQTKVASESTFISVKERDEMLDYGMVDGLNASYRALDRILDELTQG